MNFWTYFLRRVASIPPTILIILLIIFIVFSTVGNANTVSTAFPAYSDSLQSFLMAFGIFVANILTGNWGLLNHLPSQQAFTGPLNMLISIYFYSTLEVVMIAAPVALLISFPLGRYLGTHPADKMAMLLKMLVATGYLMPAYVVGLLLQVVFGRNAITRNPLVVFPMSGAFNINALFIGNSVPSWITTNGILIPQPTHMLLFDALIHGDMLLASDALMHLALPLATLIISITAVVTFSLESGYVDNMGQEYVRSARSRGIPERQVVIRHVRRNAVLPVMASATIMIAYILSNIIMMEYVFDYPGIGMFLVITMTAGQYYPAAVVIFLLGLIVIITGITIDMVNYLKNPFIRI